MKKLIGIALTLSLLLVQAASAATTFIYTPVFCSNGFQNAYNVLIVDVDTGCMVSSWGVDCNGKDYIVPQGVKKRTDTDPGWPYTLISYGTASNGATYYVKALITNGVIDKVWGQDAAGEYYVAEMTPQYES